MNLLWPNLKDQSLEEPKVNVKCPTFKNYIFRQYPPTYITDYYPIDIPKISKCSDIRSIRCQNYFIPVHDPPSWPDANHLGHSDVRVQRQSIEKLTVHSSSKSTYPLYDFNGNFYLKFFVLECYGTNDVFL